MREDDHENRESRENNEDETETRTRTTLAEGDPLDGGDVDEWVVEALLTDYEVASADARYRDRLIGFSYYLALVVGGLLLNGTVTVLGGSSLADPGTYALLAGIGAISAVNFALLLAFTDSVRAGRDSAWARRDEIEQYLRTTRQGVLDTNRSVVEGLGFDYEFDANDGPVPSKVSVGTTVRWVFAALVVVSLAGTALSVGAFVAVGG